METGLLDLIDTPVCSPTKNPSKASEQFIAFILVVGGNRSKKTFIDTQALLVKLLGIPTRGNFVISKHSNVFNGWEVQAE